MSEPARNQLRFLRLRLSARSESMKRNAYSYIYTISVWVMTVSVVCVVFAQGLLPYGVSLAWSEQGFGSSAVFMMHAVSASAGDRVAGLPAGAGQVSMYTVHESVRRDGMLHYRASDAEITNGEVVTLPVFETHRTVLFAVPFFGALVRAVVHPLGILFLVAFPLSMVLINLALTISKKMRMRGVVSSRVKAQQVGTTVKTIADSSEEIAVQKEVDSNLIKKTSVLSKVSENRGGYVTVLKPYTMRSRYSI